ncbi:MAG: hypothetical protein QXT77_09865 [Candidatus Methanomethylicaceae archaeon]
MPEYRARFIVPYFGRWPIWFPAFLVSCEKNSQFEWLILTDLDPQQGPANVRYVQTTFTDFLNRFAQALKCKVQKDFYSICDLRPAFGYVLRDLLEDVEFWGHADIDVIWGRLDIFLGADNLRQFDILSSRRSALAGHCTIYRNVDRVNLLFEEIPRFRDYLACPRLCRLNESYMAQILRRRKDIHVLWHAQYVVDQRELDRRPYSWRWENGLILDEWDVERAYLHFARWKKSAKMIDFDWSTAPRKFVITPRGFCAGSAPSLLDKCRIPPPALLYRRFYDRIRFVLTGRGRL